ncbi:MAG: BMP family ABC transporter substrate-binding protein [Candidatus Omnitrophota bacterium]
MEKKISISIPLIATLFFFSCGQSGHDVGQKPFRVILITDVGGMGDKGFNDAGWAGCQKAKEQLAKRDIMIETDVIESREQTDYVDNLNFAAERADAVVALGALIADAVEQTAKHYPDKAFIFVDGRVKGENVASFDFRSQEAACLAGILAAYSSESGTVAVIPGMDIPPVEAYAAGYKAGVMIANAAGGKNAKAISAVIGSFNDPVKGKSLALSLMNQGADVLFQLAGNSGLGVIDAVKEAPGRRFAIGVDIDQDDLAPGKILTSVLKRMDRGVAEQVIAVYEKKFYGGIVDVGLKENYTGLSEMVYTRSFVPPEALELAKRARELIVSGEMAVPRTYADLETFQPPLERLKGP